MGNTDDNPGQNEGLNKPIGDISSLSLSDIIDCEELQSMMEELYKLTHILGAVLDLSGNVLVAVGWQDICTKFHRCHPDTRKHCLESDTILSNGLAPGEFKAYRCKNNMWDMVTPIEIDGRHLGNMHLGQFLYEDETPDYDLFRSQARQYGFDEKEYLAALDRVPRLSRETADTAMRFYAKLAQMISSLGYSKAHLSRALSQNELSLRQLAEIELKQSAMISNISDVIGIIGTDSMMTYKSPNIEKMFGWQPQDLIGTDGLLTVHPDDLERIQGVFYALLETDNASKTMEFRYKCKDGSYKPIELTATNLTNNPAIAGVLLNYHDITHRKQMETVLQESEEKYRLLYSSMDQGLGLHEIITDDEGKPVDYIFLDINDSYTRLLGVTREMAIGRRIKEVMPEVEQYWIDVFGKVAQTGEPYYYENFLKTTGKYYSTYSYCPKKNQFAVLVTDITERKQAEELLRESEERFKQLSQATWEAIVIHDGGVVLEANTQYFEMTGYTAEELIGQQFIPLTATLESGKYIQEQIRTGNLGPYEATGKRKDGTEFPIELRIRTMNYHGRQVRVAAIRDLTDQKKAAKMLVESNEDLKESQRIAHVGSWRLDISTNDVKWSDELYKMYGFDPSLPPPPYSEHHKIFTPESWDRLSKALPKTVETGIPYELELETLRKDGSNGWMWVRGEVVLDEKAVIVGLRGAAQDITERKQDEKALRESEENLSITLHSIGDAVISTDKNGRVLQMNPIAEHLCGWNLADAAGNPLADVFRIVNAETRETVADPVKKVLEKGEIVGLANHTVLVSKNGSEYQIADSAAPIKTKDGEIYGVVLVFSDVTETYAVQKKIKESEKRYRSLLQNLEAGIVIHAPDTSIVMNNHRASVILGLSDDQIKGKTAIDPDWKFINEENAPLPLEEYPVNRIITCKKPIRNQLIGIQRPETKDTVWVTVNGFPMYDSAGDLSEIVISIIDITESHRAEKEQEKLQTQLAQAQKMESVGRLAGGVAHDFNNMLGVILGHTEMMLEQVDPEQPVFEDLEEIRKAAVRSADLTRQLLAFARQQTVSPKLLDLNKTVDSMLKMLQRLIGEDIALEWLPSEESWLINIDPSQIDQILANLCINARDAIVNVGRLIIETGIATFDKSYCMAHPGFTPGEFVLLAVSDNGCGMDTETQANIFEPFFTTKELGKGTGLGLSTVYGIVKQNNGFINIYSEIGQGTTFKIYLPRHIGKSGTRLETGLSGQAERGHETILLVEDEPAILKMTAIMLERLGYKVLRASTPGEAFSLAHEFAGEIHLLMTDVVMPEMNGRDLAKNLLKLYPNLNRLFMSGYTANLIAHHGVLDKGVHFIQKPFSKKDLADKVRAALGNE